MSTKKTSTPADLEDFLDLEAQKPQGDVTKAAKEKTGALVKIRAKSFIRSSYGAFNEGIEYDVEQAVADVLIKDGRAEKCL